MPESANRAAGVVYSATEPFTSEEYIKTLLENFKVNIWRY